VTVPHDDDVSPCVPAAPLRSPEVKDIVQVEVCQERTCATPLGRPFRLLSPLPILQHARLEPLANVTDDALVPNPVLDKLHQPFVVNRIIEAPNVGIEYPVDVALFNAYRDCIQCMVRAASRTGTVRETEKLLLVNGVEHLDRRPLDDFVLQRRLANGALAPIGFGDVDPLDWRSLVRSPLEPVRQLPQVGFALFAVVGPCLAIHPPGCVMIEAVIRFPQSGCGVDMVPQRSQPLSAILCCLPYPVQRT